MQFLTFFFYILTLFNCLFITRSIISPIMIFIVNSGVFFSSIFLNSHSVLAYVIYFTILSCINFHNILIYKWVNVSNNIKVTHALFYPKTKFLFILLFITLVLYLFINKFGGLFTFIIASKRGTEEFYGLGHYKTAVGMIYPLGLISYILYSFNVSKKPLDFIINFIIQLFVIFIALLSMSRGTIINYFISLFLCSFILGQKFSKLTYVSFAIIALTFASFLGSVRETINFNDSSFSLGVENTDTKFKTEWMEFGTFPIDQIYYNQNNELSYGLTYLTAITNLVPRAIWPKKPDPGGVVFTRDYTNGMYDEFNQYSTGLFPEAMINFGIFGGYIFGVSLFLFLTIGSSYLYYKYILNKFYIHSIKDAFILTFYIYLFLSIPALLTAEFTNVITALIIKFLTLLFFYYILKIKIFNIKLNLNNL